MQAHKFSGVLGACRTVIETLNPKPLMIMIGALRLEYN